MVCREMLDSQRFLSQMGQEWDDRVSHDYRYWMSDGVQDDEAMWQTGRRDLESLIQDLDPTSNKAKTFLELGCGVGRLLKSAAEKFGSVIGVDISGQAIAQAKKLLADISNVNLIQGDGDTLSQLNSNSIDIAVSFASLCSIPASVTASYFAELARVVRPNGELKLQVYLGQEQIPEREDTLGIRSYDRTRFENAARAAGFDLISINELKLHFEVSDKDLEIIAAVVSLKRNLNSPETAKNILLKLISEAEKSSGTWLGSETAYQMSLSRADALLSQGDFERARDALELAVRSYSKVEPEILQLLTELRAIAWKNAEEKKRTKVITSLADYRDGSNYLEANLEELRKINPALAEQLKAEPSKNVTIQSSSSGDLIVQVGGTPLDNTEKPVKAAQLWVERTLQKESSKSIASLMVIGFATGYHIEHLCKQSQQSISVYEPNVDLLRVVFRVRDLRLVIGRLKSLSTSEAEVLSLFESNSEYPELLIYPQSQLVSRNEIQSIKAAFFSKRGRTELKPNIAVVGPIYGGTLPITHSTARALGSMGQRARCLDMSPFHRGYFDLEGFVRNRARKDNLQSHYVEMLSQIVLESISESPVDIVICLAQAPLSARVLTELRSRGIITVMWFVEDCSRFTAWKHISQYFDYMFLIQNGDVLSQVEAAGAGRAIYLPTACEPAVQKPLSIDEIGDSKRWGSELSFVGAGYNNRQQMFASLANRDFKIWGTEWSQLPPFDRLVQEGGRRISPEEYVKIFNASKINLNLHSSMERDGVEPHGDFVNPRTFELASCGAFQLVDERKLLPEVFEVGKEIITFTDYKELEDKADYYLAHPEERKIIATRARQRALRDHTYEKRLEQMLGHIYADRYEDLKSRSQANPWNKTLKAAKKYPELYKRLEKVYNRGDDPKMQSLISDIQTQSGKLTEEELKLLFVWHVGQSVETMENTRAGRVK